MLPPVVVPFKELRKAGAALGNGAVPPYVDVVVLDITGEIYRCGISLGIAKIISLTKAIRSEIGV